MSELADASYQLSPTMTGIIDRLMERGLVTRERDPNDRRALLVELTPEGRQMMERIKEHKRGWMRRFLYAMSPDEREVINAVLLHFLEVVEGLPAQADETIIGVS
jgi:DNA-binding MarR family transcriptional regulator